MRPSRPTWWRKTSRCRHHRLAQDGDPDAADDLRRSADGTAILRLHGRDAPRRHRLGPWNHTAAGNRVFNLVIDKGGTSVTDEGSPTPDPIGRTIANLREISPTSPLNVPLGYQLLIDAGAGMNQPVRDRITRVAEAAVAGGRPALRRVRLDRDGAPRAPVPPASGHGRQPRHTGPWDRA
jgi:hypothetical protein